MLIAILFVYICQTIYNKVGKSRYSRASLENVMVELLGDYRIDEVLSDEVLVVAYDYNSQEPRFFSKHFSHADSGIYDVTVGNATAASSAAPTFFDPKVQMNRYNLTEMQIDGGIICNNPAFYAYQIARVFDERKNIRVLSIGTGEKPFATINAKTVSFLDFMTKTDEFMMNMDTYTADHWLNDYMEPENYIRLQTSSGVGMDKIDDESINQLKLDGQKMYDESQEKLETFIKTIMDERFGSGASLIEEEAEEELFFSDRDIIQV